MTYTTKIIFSICIYFLLGSCWASADGVPPWFSNENGQVKLRVALFLSSKCPYCQNAARYFQTLQTTMPWIQVDYYTINVDQAALQLFSQYLQLFDSNDFSIPAIFFCNTRWVGFDQNLSGKELFHALNYCRSQIIKVGQLTPVTINIVQEWASAQLYANQMSPSKTAWISYIFPLAISDAIYSCSLFTLMFLFALIILCENKFQIVAVSIISIFAISIVHIMHGQIILFLNVNHGLRIPVIILGLILLVVNLLKLVDLWGNIINLNIFALINNKVSFIYSRYYVYLTLIAIATFIISMYAQNCAPNFMLIMDQWLISQKLLVVQTIWYQFSYYILYILPLIISVLLLVYCLKFFVTKQMHLLAQTISHTMLMLIAILLIFYPQGLASFWISVLTMTIAIICSFLIKKYYILGR